VSSTNGLDANLKRLRFQLQLLFEQHDYFLIPPSPVRSEFTHGLLEVRKLYALQLVSFNGAFS
jgi:hypothetical protein